MWPVSAEAATCQINQLCDCCHQSEDIFLRFKVAGLHRGNPWIQITTWYCATSTCVVRGVCFFTLYFVTAKSWEGNESWH